MMTQVSFITAGDMSLNNISTQSIFLCFHRNDGCANELQRYVTRTLPVLLYFLTGFKKNYQLTL